jgi:alpha-D-ribose 1-methylphosphonate 5-triphosphate synthase subunit PhnH
MTPQQQMAFENPCRFAFETAQPKFAVVDYARMVSIIVTLNSGYE